MAKMPEPIEDSPTVRAIYAAYEKRSGAGRASRRLGASQIGHACPRKVWYDFRWAGRETFGGRMLRLFATGHLEEPRFQQDLLDIGCEVHLNDPATGGQFEFTDIGGHFVAKIDGAAVGIPEAPKAWHSCEFKTHSAKSFAGLKSHGLKAAKPDHYAQTVVGMRLSGMPRGLYLAKNKDTDELYSERFRIDDVGADADAILAHARHLIELKTAPDRVSQDRESLTCRFCCHVDRCHGSAAPAPGVVAAVTCRSCVHATPVVEDGGIGRWRCEKHRKTLDEHAQQRACPDHLFIPDFITFAEMVDGGLDRDGDWIAFRNPDGSTWEHSRRKSSSYRSIELTVLPAPMVGHPGDEKTLTVDDLKKQLGATVTEMVSA